MNGAVRMVGGGINRIKFEGICSRTVDDIVFKAGRNDGGTPVTNGDMLACDNYFASSGLETEELVILWVGFHANLLAWE